MARSRLGEEQIQLSGFGGGREAVPLGYQEPEGCHAEREVMVEAPPISPFKVAEAQFRVPDSSPAVRLERADARAPALSWSW